LTLAVEVPIAALLGLRTSRALLTVVLVNLLTNPLLNFAGILVAQFDDWAARPAIVVVPALVVAEMLVVVAEWRLLTRVLGGGSRRFFLTSLAMNAASALAGIVFWID
jgi:hypothetical protein